METATYDAPVGLGKIETPRQFAQLFVPVLDGSGSMTDAAPGNITKAQATNSAVRGLLTRMKVSRIAPNFSCGLITFDTTPTVVVPTQDLSRVDDNGDYDPLRGHGGGTNIYAALEAAETMVSDFLALQPAGGVSHKAVIILMSDGCCSEPARTRQVAARLKTTYAGKLTLACTLFGTIGQSDAAGEQLLREIASDPVRYFKTVYDAETLRQFMLASVSAASGTALPPGGLDGRL
jgi:uncharacterized protein YegL